MIIESSLRDNQIMCPYVGTQPFEEKENFIFFGRERDTEILINNIYNSQFLVMFAPSGVGKSSLINAGIIPQLRKVESFQIFYFNDWNIRFSDQLTQTLSLGTNDKNRSLITVLRERFRRTGKLPVIILDQFEDIIRYEQNLSNVWDALAPIGNVRDKIARVVIVLCEDYLGKLNDLMDRIPNLMQNRFCLESMRSADIRSAIEELLKKVSPPWQAERDLVERIIENLSLESSITPKIKSKIEPGYLQLVCKRLWELHQEENNSNRILQLKIYENEGGVQNIVEGHIRRIIEKNLSELDRHIFYAMSRYLVTPTGVKITLSAEDLAGLVRQEDFTKNGLRFFEDSFKKKQEITLLLKQSGVLKRIKKILETFCETEVLILRRRTSVDRIDYEFCHDLLGPIILDWRNNFLKNETENLDHRLNRIIRLSGRFMGLLMMVPIVVFYLFPRLMMDFPPFADDPTKNDSLSFYISIGYALLGLLLFMFPKFSVALFKPYIKFFIKPFKRKIK